jgi:hypothetical protein
LFTSTELSKFAVIEMSFSKAYNNNKNQYKRPYGGPAKKSMIDDIMGKVKDGGEGYLWEAHCQAHQWMIRKAAIVTRFAAKGVWRYVDPTQGQQNPPQIPPTEMPNLSAVQLIDPEAKTEEEILARIALYNTYRDEQGGRIDASNRTEQKKAIAHRNLLEQIERDKLHLKVNRLDIKSKYVSEATAQQKQIEKYETDINNVQAVFTRTFDTNTLNAMHEDLRDNNFRKIWKSLQDKYETHMNNGSTTQSALLNVYNTFVYEPQHKIERNIVFIELLGAALNKNSDGEKALTLFRMLKGSHLSNNIKLQIEQRQLFWETKTSFATYVDLRDDIVRLVADHELESNHKQFQQQKQQLAKATHAKAAAAAAAAAKRKAEHGDGSRKKATNLRCEYCKKQGHTEDNCWLKHPCTHCGKNNHSSDKCYKKPTDGKPSNLSDMFNAQH